MAKVTKKRTYIGTRTYIVIREANISATSLEEAAGKLKELEFDNFDNNQDVTDTGEEQIYLEYNSCIERKI